MRFLLIITILVTVVSSCNNQEKIKSVSFKNEYQQILSNYPNQLIKHFPDTSSIKIDYSIYQDFPSKYGQLNLFVSQYENEDVIDGIMLKSNRIKDTDSSFVIVNKHLTTENRLSLPGQYLNYEVQKYVIAAKPIPNFKDVKGYDKNTSSGLSKDFSIFILDSKPNRCCSDSLHSGEWHMPEEWQDGYSYGYAINKKENKVIYWLSIW